ncbi:type IV pilin [Halosimplex marinum]|uniref:type IV pilin n=1 Tax=Halosimplex marinum TaxID=3396620 RepID=UPI003F546A88
MDIKQLFDDDDAVSPVIGVILMVAITVILAAVIASFVLGLGNQAQQGAPTATIGFDYEQDSDLDDGPAGNLTISHDGGDTIRASELYIRGSGFNDDYNESAGGVSYEVDRDSAGSWARTADDGPNPNYGPESEITSGNRIVVAVESNYEIDVVYQAQEGDTSSTLNSDEGPDA